MRCSSLRGEGRKLGRCIAALVVACASHLLVTDEATAQSYTWVGNTSANWATGTNWSPTFVSWPGGVYNYLTFGTAGTSGTTLNNDVGGGVTLSGLTFQSSAPAYTINGNQISLWDQAVVSNASSATQTINTPLYIRSSGSFSGNFLLSGSLSGNGGGWTMSSGTLQLTGSSPGFTNPLTLSSARIVIGNNAALGTAAITGVGSIEASVDLTGVNAIANALNIGSYSSLTIAGTNNLTTTGNLTINSAASQTAMVNNLAPDKTFTISGTTTVNGNASVTTLTGSGNTTYAGPIVGSGGNFTSTNTGLTTFSGSNSYSGVTTVSNGTLLATRPVALPNYSTSGKVSVASGATLAVQAGGAGEWDGTAIDSLLATTAFSASSNIGVSVTSGNSFQYGNNLGTTQASKGLTKRGAGTLALTGTNTYTGATLVTGGTLQIGNGSTSGAINSTSGISLSNNATLAFNRSDDYGGRFTKAISGAGNIVVSAGTVTVGSGVTYTGNTTIDAGVLRLNPTSFASPTAVTAQSAWDSSTWSATQTINGSGMTPSSPVTEFSAASNASGNWFSNNNSQTTWITWDLGSEKSVSGFHLWNFNYGGYTSRSVKVAEIYSGTSSLANASSYASAGSAWGTLVTTGTFSQATGQNTYTGEDFLFASPVTTRYVQFKVLSNWGTDLYTGLSEIGFYSPASDILPTTTNVTLSASGALDINGGGQSVNSLSSSSANARVWLGSGQLTVTGSSSTTFAGQITDSGGANAGVGGRVTKSGAGTLTLTGSNTYTGVTSINAGTLQLGDGGATGSLNTGSTITGSAGGTLAFNRANLASQGIDFRNGIGGGLGLSQLGSGTLALTGTNAFTGATTISAGAIAIDSANALQSTSGVSIAGGAGLRYVGSQGTFDRNISVTSGRGSVTNAGSGTLTLSGTLTKNGTVLRLAGTNPISVTGQITGSSANSDLFVDGVSVTLSNTNNNYNGPTYVYNGGSITLGASNVIPGGSALILGGTGSDSGIGMITAGTFTDTIASLTSSSLGSTVGITVSGATAGGLSMGSLSFGSGTDTLALTLSSPTAVRYTLLSYSSRSGQFDSVTGAGNYNLIYGGTGTGTIDLQLKANQTAAFTLTPAAGRVLVGGSTQLSGVLANSSTTGASALAWSPTSTGTLTASGFTSSVGSTIAAGSTSSITAWVVAGNTAGNQTWSITNSDTSAITQASVATGSLTVVNVRTYTSPTTIALGRVLINGAAVGSGTVTSSQSYETTVTGTLGSYAGSAINGVTLTGAGGVFNGTNTSAAYSLSGSVTGTAGQAVAGTFYLASTNEFGTTTGSAANISFTATTVAQRSFTTSVSTIAFGNVHQGKSLSSTLTVTSTGLNATTANASLGSFSTGPNGLSLTTSDSTVFSGSASQSATYALAGTASALGSLSGTLASKVSAELGSINDVTLAITGNVYSGQSTWTGAGGGSWGSLSSGFGSNWGTNQGSPGLDSGFANTDTATFAGTVASGTATIDLTGVAPSLKAITFTNSSARYLLSSGSITMSSDSGTASLTANAGSHEIASSLTLASLTSVTTGSGATLTLSGAIDGSGGFVKAGVGTLNLMAANSYSGNTAINAGTLKIFNTKSFGSGTVTLASGATLDLDNLTITNALVNLGGTIINSGSYMGAQTVSGTATYAGSTNGTIAVSSGGSATFSGPVAATVTLANGASATVFGAVASTAVLAVNANSVLTAAQGSSFAAGSTISNDGRFDVNTAGTTPIASDITGSGLLAVSGGGLVQLTGANSGFNGQTTVSGNGTHLAVNSALGATSVTIDAGAILGGSGSISGVLSGAGLVSPGNSPGILTASQFDPAGGLGAAFEFTQSAPVYNAPSASLNDVLRLTDSSKPFVSSLTGVNHIDVYFNVSSTIKTGDIFEGGFFTGLSATDLLTAIKHATFTYWVKDTFGTTSFNGSNYSLLTSVAGITGANVTTVQRTADFGSGGINGSVTQFVIIPEPDTIIFAGIGIAMAGWSLWKRRRIAQMLRK